MIKIENLSFTYPDSNFPALDHIDLGIKEGEFLAITGRNGSGKSTLIKTLLGIIPDTVNSNFQGQITLEGQPIENTLSIASKIGVLLQNPDSQITNLTVLEEVFFGLENLCLPINDILQRADSSINQMSLQKIINQSTYQLSGGQKQRLSLASLLAMKPRILIMDEPLANLDDDGINSVIASLKILRSQVDIIIVSSHDIKPFLDLMTRIIVMDKGQISLDFPISQIEKHIPELIFNGLNLSQKNIIINPSHQSTNTNLINLSHVSFSYKNGIKPLIDVNLEISEGEKIVLVGKNGVGKSTLAKLLVGLRKPTHGKIESQIRRPKLVPQDVSLSFIENSVIEELTSQNIKLSTAGEILIKCNLKQYESRSPFQLSGGQQKLLAIASALATNPDFIVIDEPTAGLDADYVNLILQMTSQNTSVLHITHDHRVISQANRIITLKSGTIFEEGDKI